MSKVGIQIQSFSCQDLEAGREGGTWLAISGKGGVIRFGALLNITGEINRPDATGRGSLVSNYVTSTISNEEFCRNLVDTSEQYNPFNLITVELQDKQARIILCSNSPIGFQEWPVEVPLGFSNSQPEVPFGKVIGGKQKFQKILENQEDKNVLVDNLMEMLHCRDKYWGENMSSICVKMQEAGYGTRTHTVLLVDWQNRMDFYESTMVTSEPDDPWKKTHIFRQL